MPNSARGFLLRPALLLACTFFVTGFCLNGRATAQPGNQGAGFLGGWCAQGNPGKQASISSNGLLFQLTNEQGNSASGTLQGPNQMLVPQWQFVTGTLSGDGSQINWSNGTFWARCNNGNGGGGWNRPIRLNGTWFAMGHRDRRCSIQQHHGDLTLQNDAGQGATGSFTGKHHIVTNWSGTTIRGHISDDGGRIDWDNGTYWIRDRLYTQ
jgi:hypothetical protein